MHGLIFRTAAATLLAALSAVAQETVAWYNGDPAPFIAGVVNRNENDRFLRVYDDFIVPAGGWTVTGLFSVNTIADAAVTEASWEIRANLSAGNSGVLVASGRGPATQRAVPAYVENTFRIQVGGLRVELPPGRYWVNVAPVIPAGKTSWLRPTLGLAATGDPPGNNGSALNASFQAVAATGNGGTTSDFSQGVLISGPAPGAIITPSYPWQANIAALSELMPRYHSVPFPGIELEEWKARAADLFARVPSLSEAEIRTGVQALVAAIGDSHTDVGWGSVGLARLPLSFYWFDDGVYVTAAPEQYANLVGGKVDWIGQTGIDEALRRLGELVPHENEAWLKHSIPLNKLPVVDFLAGTKITPDTSTATISVTHPSGESVSAEVRPGPGGTMVRAFTGELPLYRKNESRSYWATPFQDGATVYFQYNRCQEDPAQPSVDFFKELDDMLAKGEVQRLIVDMRNNGGGFVSIHNPWIDRIKLSRFNRTGGLYIIVGRSTFSAAMDASDRLRDETAAIFVGERTGAKPRFMIRQGAFALPYFGVTVSYSSGVRKTNAYNDTLVPDIVTGLTFQQYLDGEDPALDAILRIPLPGN